ncbi:hypothetical protein [Cellulophaga sp. Z1A5H]|uniref:hypothetical protein n=1 Tax=Cellulophaga sp. Z1A5H TaxID=2687291 RepID=UPI0013FE125E|nr:hypothetical protein [Cellulophaga sp. Z1A5H]
MKLGLNIALVALLLLVGSCKEQPKKTETVTSKEVQEPAYHIPETWVANRVGKAKERLNATDAGKIVWSAMEAHGGLATWYNNGYLAFRFDYQPLDGSTRRNSYQTIDTWNNKARHTSYADSTAIFGWDGKEAWVKAKDSTAFEYDTRFWALTPLYLAAHPFILDGEGVNLELLPQKEYKGKLQDVVKVTFGKNVGDAPDDFYILYFDKDTHINSATRYIVSYPQYFPKGGHAPEKIMEIVGQKETNGILLPTGLKTHWLDENEEMGEYITKIEISDVTFIPEVPEGYFSKPEGAKLVPTK